MGGAAGAALKHDGASKAAQRRLGLWTCGPLFVLFGPLDLGTFGPLHLWASVPLDLGTFGPWGLWTVGSLHLCTFAPLDLWTFALLGRYTPSPLHLWTSGPCDLWKAHRYCLSVASSDHVFLDLGSY